MKTVFSAQLNISEGNSGDNTMVDNKKVRVICLKFHLYIIIYQKVKLVHEIWLLRLGVIKQYEAFVKARNFMYFWPTETVDQFDHIFGFGSVHALLSQRRL